MEHKLLRNATKGEVKKVMIVTDHDCYVHSPFILQFRYINMLYTFPSPVQSDLEAKHFFFHYFHLTCLFLFLQLN